MGDRGAVVFRIVSGALGVAVLIAAVFGGVQWLEVRRLAGALQEVRAELVAEQLARMGCDAAVQNILEDVSDDAKIDALSGDDLLRVPDSWMLRGSGAGRGSE